jgi:hypothetical protein
MKSRYLLFFGVLLLLFSCTSPVTEKPGDSGQGDSGQGNPGQGNPNPPGNRPSRIFWAADLTREGYYYQVNADLLAEGKLCKVYAEKDSGFSEAQAGEIAAKFDDVIYPAITGTFDINETFTYAGNTFANSMQFADWFGDGSGKVNLLYCKIRDGYDGTKNLAYVSGYFDSVNFLGYNVSNSCAMIYLNTLLDKPGFADSGTTIAHELQHLLNFANSWRYRLNGNTIYSMDTWINEGLSGAAEYVYNGYHSQERIKWYNQPANEGGMIREGNNFFVWRNREGSGPGQNQYAVLDDYATVYLFFQWLRIHAGGTGIYGEIEKSPYPDYGYRAVTNAADKLIAGNSFNSWEILLKTWLAANYIRAGSGIYGYKNQIILEPKTYTAGTTASLFPGEGVYSSSPSIIPGNSSGNIRYTGLTTTGLSTVPGSSGALLTFNANINNGMTVAAENGTTTGTASIGIEGFRLPAQVPFTGPYAIGAGDLKARNGHPDLIDSGMIKVNRE